MPPASTNPNGIGPLPADLGRWDGSEIVADWQINWQEVALLRAQASDQLSAAVGEDRTMDPDAEREFGRSIIQELTSNHSITPFTGRICDPYRIMSDLFTK